MSRDPLRFPGPDLGSIWRSRKVWLAILAIVVGLYAQSQIVQGARVPVGVFWYSICVVLTLVAWGAGYQNKRMLVGPAVTPRRQDAVAPDAWAGRRDGWLRRGTALRYAVVVAALAVNLLSVSALRADYASTGAGLGWLFSLVLLALAFVREPRPAVQSLDAGVQDIDDRHQLHLSRRLEWGIAIAVCLLALALRLYRLGDITTGVHGDEGEAGMDALGILQGGRVSPFLSGWFSQPNFYYWAIALGMQVFGTDLFGLRMFTALAGSLMLPPFYLLVRTWFGPRTAIFAALLLAFSDVAIHFSKQQFSNITTPLSLVVGLLFLFRGLQTRSTLSFVLAAYSFVFSMYFYLGGRLAPLLVGLILLYQFVLMPIVGVPGAYRRVRRLIPGLWPGLALLTALRQESRPVLHFAAPLVIFGVATFCMMSPWLVYFVDHQAEWNLRVNDKVILNNEARMAHQHGAKHEPLYLGLRLPGVGNGFLGAPVVLEQNREGLPVWPDGFWPRAIWGQANLTLAIFTHAADASSVYTFAQAPVTKPMEAVLLFMGLAWALWRWRDVRMAALSIWFWATFFAGGVFTIDAPYMARLVGLIPAMSIAAALPLNKLVVEAIELAGKAKTRLPSFRSFSPVEATSTLVVALVLATLGFQNFRDYYLDYLAAKPFTVATGQAVFVREMNATVEAEGRPAPRYYSLGTHHLYWGYGVNRFLNRGTVGIDMVNPSEDLPLVGDDGHDVIFIVWDSNQQYLPVISSYYPDGERADFNYGPIPTSRLFTYYRVKREEIEARRRVWATYTPAEGRAVMRREREIAQEEPSLPLGMDYPVRVSWSGQLHVPKYGRYRFRLDADQGAALRLDGTELIAEARREAAEVDVVLARGLHEIELAGNLENPRSRARLLWDAGGDEYLPIRGPSLWEGPGRGLAATAWPLVTDLLTSTQMPAANDPSIIQRRVDGFIGFRNTPGVVSRKPFSTVWKGALLAPVDGTYQIELFTDGAAALLLNGARAVEVNAVGDRPTTSATALELTAGSHDIEVRYNWSQGTGFLDLYWEPPDRTRALIGPQFLALDPEAPLPLLPSAPVAPTQPEPPALSPPPMATTTAQAGVPQPATLGAALSNPRGLAVDGDGNLYVGDRGNGRIVVYSQRMEPVRSWGRAARPANPPSAAAGEFVDVADIAVSSEGLVYVLDAGTRRVQVFDSEGSLQQVAEQELGLASPNGLALGVSGPIYIADTAHSRVARVTRDSKGHLLGNPQGLLGGDAPPRKFEQPLDVALDPLVPGRVFAVDLRDRIVLLDDAGRILRQWLLPVSKGDGGSRLATSPDGQLVYMTDPDRQRLVVLRVSDGTVRYFGGNGPRPELRLLSGIAVGADGQIYALDRQLNTIHVISVSEIESLLASPPSR